MIVLLLTPDMWAACAGDMGVLVGALTDLPTLRCPLEGSPVAQAPCLLKMAVKVVADLDRMAIAAPLETDWGADAVWLDCSGFPDLVALLLRERRLH